MDPYLEISPLFQELHTQFLAEAQARLQPQLRPKYVARLERHLSEGSVWEPELGISSLEGKEPDISIAATAAGATEASLAVLALPTAVAEQALDPDELQLRKQRRIVIYLQSRPRQAVASIELLSPSNKAGGSVGQTRFLEKRSSALHGGLHWVEIDLLRGGQRPPVAVKLPRAYAYLAYVAQATSTGWRHHAYGWNLRDPLPLVPIPLLGSDQASLDLTACLGAAYERIAADEEIDYASDPPPPPLSEEDRNWLLELLRQHGLR
jgi:hypothetical protein